MAIKQLDKYIKTYNDQEIQEWEQNRHKLAKNIQDVEAIIREEKEVLAEKKEAYKNFTATFLNPVQAEINQIKNGLLTLTLPEEITRLEMALEDNSSKAEGITAALNEALRKETALNHKINPLAEMKNKFELEKEIKDLNTTINELKTEQEKLDYTHDVLQSQFQIEENIIAALKTKIANIKQANATNVSSTSSTTTAVYSSTMSNHASANYSSSQTQPTMTSSASQYSSSSNSNLSALEKDLAQHLTSLSVYNSKISQNRASHSSCTHNLLVKEHELTLKEIALKQLPVDTQSKSYGSVCQQLQRLENDRKLVRHDKEQIKLAIKHLSSEKMQLEADLERGKDNLKKAQNNRGEFSHITDEQQLSDLLMNETAIKEPLITWDNCYQREIDYSENVISEQEKHLEELMQTQSLENKKEFLKQYWQNPQDLIKQLLQAIETNVTCYRSNSKRVLLSIAEINTKLVEINKSISNDASTELLQIKYQQLCGLIWQEYNVFCNIKPGNESQLTDNEYLYGRGLKSILYSHPISEKAAAHEYDQLQLTRMLDDELRLKQTNEYLTAFNSFLFQLSQLRDDTHKENITLHKAGLRLLSDMQKHAETYPDEVPYHLYTQLLNSGNLLMQHPTDAKAMDDFLALIEDEKIDGKPSLLGKVVGGALLFVGALMASIALIFMETTPLCLTLPAAGLAVCTVISSLYTFFISRDTGIHKDLKTFSNAAHHASFFSSARPQVEGMESNKTDTFAVNAELPMRLIRHN